MDGLFILVALVILGAAVALWGHDSRDTGFVGHSFPPGSVWW